MKAITYYEKEKVFVLNTKNSTYQMQIVEYGVLTHLYYGRNVGNSLITERIVRKDRGFSGNPYEAGNDRTFSLDVLPQEYAGAGNGDYRLSSLEIQNEDGSNVTDLRYVSHQIYSGKYSLKGLPAAYAEEAETLEIVMEDETTKIQVILYYGVIPEYDIITRAAKIVNRSEHTAVIKKAMSVSLDMENSDLDMIHFYGRHGMERITERQPLHHGQQSVGSTRGTSSHHHNPFIILCAHEATEDYGDCYGMSLLYSGNFTAAAEVDQVNQTRFAMGIHPEHFAYRLGKEEEFITPEVMMSYSGAGLSKLSRSYHDAYRNCVCRGKYVHERRPVLVNNWEATYFEFDEKKLYHIAEEAKKIGIEMLVMDDGWFGKRDDDNSGLGDWAVNTKKLKGGLKPLVEKVNRLGLKFGIWVEPEMISEDSDLYREHPDWCMKIPGRPVNRSRFQLNLDITRQEVRDYIMDSLFQVFDSCNIEYVKWDMNRSLSNVYSAALQPEEQGEVYHRYVLGLYEMMERLISRYPDLLLETCSGGGGRFDGGMLYYSPQIWCSDNTDAVERLKIQYGTSFGYPVSTAGSHVSACPNHQTGRTTPFSTRGIVAMAGTFGYELDLEKMTEEEKELARKQIEEYKNIAPFVIKGDYYRLTDPFTDNRYVLWQYISKDQKEAVIQGVQVRPECNGSIQIVKAKGLSEEKEYMVDGMERIYTGAALMYAGIPLPDMSGDYQPVQFFIHEV